MWRSFVVKAMSVRYVGTRILLCRLLIYFSKSFFCLMCHRVCLVWCWHENPWPVEFSSWHIPQLFTTHSIFLLSHSTYMQHYGRLCVVSLEIYGTILKSNEKRFSATSSLMTQPSSTFKDFFFRSQWLTTSNLQSNEYQLIKIKKIYF